MLLAVLLTACGGAPSTAKTKAEANAPAAPTAPLCSPELQALDFAKIAAADEAEAVLEEDTSKVDNLILGLHLGSDANYAKWGPTGDLLVALSGCEEGECSAGVALIERNDHGFFVKKADASLPSVLDGDVDLDHVFIANLIGDESPEFWVVYSTFGQDDESEMNIAAYTISGLKLLWSKTLGTADDPCISIVYTSDTQCDGLGDVIVKRSCENAPTEEVRYLWQGGKLRAP
jgi:hypothetical protein